MEEFKPIAGFSKYEMSGTMVRNKTTKTAIKRQKDGTFYLVDDAGESQYIKPILEKPVEQEVVQEVEVVKEPEVVGDVKFEEETKTTAKKEKPAKEVKEKKEKAPKAEKSEKKEKSQVTAPGNLKVGDKVKDDKGTKGELVKISPSSDGPGIFNAFIKTSSGTVKRRLSKVSLA